MRRIVKRALGRLRLRERSLFLWGPRKTGKSWWLRAEFPDAVYIDLLQTEVFAEYASRPGLLRDRQAVWQQERPSRLVIIDEIQKCPSLLDEVHWLIENRGQVFVLSGSSARELRRDHANLLGGRAWRREMRPFCFAEVGAVNLESAMVSGLLPPHFLASEPREDLRGYVADYLRDEIALEAQRRDIPAFTGFLRVAALAAGELLNYASVAREAGVSAKVVRGYFDLLEDTLLGFRIAPWTRSRNRRMILTEKFYLFDVGVANHLARREPKEGTPEFGRSLEQILLMELTAYRAYRAQDMEVTFWRTSTGQEVDFILNDKAVAVELKAGKRVGPGDLGGLTALGEDGPVRRRILVSLEREPREFRDARGKIELLPWRIFLERLWSGDLV